MTKRVKLVLLVVILLTGLQYAFSQVKELKGVVKDSQGLPLPGVSVVVKGTTKGVETDFDGNYKISVSKGNVLVFSFLSMKTVEYKVGSDRTYNLVMQDDVQQLTDVVVVGYGTGRKVGTVVGSVAKVGGKELASKPTGNVMDAVQGKVAGLQVFTSSGEPSEVSSMTLHGIGSFGASSTPLYIIDGTPGSISNLNSNDIESFTVLKDASATSIYGSRAANGVVYITTKKGKKNKEMEVSVNSQVGLSSLANRDFFRRYMSSEELVEFRVEFDPARKQTFEEYLKKYPGVNTHWDEIFYRDNRLTNLVDVSASGGNDKTTYYMSASALSQEGSMYNSNLDKYTLRSNLDSKIKSWLKVGLNISSTYSEFETNRFSVNANLGGMGMFGGLVAYLPPYFPIKNPKTGKEYWNEYIPGAETINPKHLNNMVPTLAKVINFEPNAYIEVKPLKKLTFKTQMGARYNSQSYNSSVSPVLFLNKRNGEMTADANRFISKTITNTLEYKFSLKEKNNFVLLLGQEQNSEEFEKVGGKSSGHISEKAFLLSTGTKDKDVLHDKWENVTKSLFARVEYDFDEKYIFDASVRRDGSSKFGRNNRYSNFWSTGAMWRIKKEEFMQMVNWVNDLSVKFSVGTSGNSDIGNYESFSRIAMDIQYNGNTAFTVAQVENPNLTWEKQTKYTLGFNTRLFDRLSLNIDLYKRLTKDMLYDVPYPTYTGFKFIKENIGKLENKGVDLTFSYDLFKDKKYFVTPYLNFNYNKQEIVELFKGQKYWSVSHKGEGFIVGEPIKFIAPIFDKINPQTGLAQWYNPKDPAKKHTDSKDVTTVFNTNLAQNTGKNRFPAFSGGFGFNAGYKQWSISADFSFVYGKYMMNNDRFFAENPIIFSDKNQWDTVKDYWKKVGDKTKYPRKDTPTKRFLEFDDRMLEDSSFIRLKNLQVGYTLSENALKSLKYFNSMKFYVTARNYLTFTKYTGMDPELNDGIALGGYPNTKQLVFGIDFKF